jgi:AcrR family transcriptional regulator
MTEVRETRRKEILLSALEWFSKDGYHKTRIENIARKAGISKGLIYTYYNSKEELLKALIVFGLKDLEQYIQIPDKETIAKEDLINLINNVFEMFLKNQNFWKLYSSIIAQTDVMAIVSEEIKTMAQSQMKLLEGLMEKTGSISPKEDAYILGAIFDGISFHYHLNPKDFPIESIKARIKDLFLKI